MLSSLTFNGVQLLGGSSYALHDPVEGLEAPLYRLAEYDKPGEDGGVVAAAYYGERPLVLNGLIQGGTAAAYEANRQALQAACLINKDSNGYPQLATISFTTAAGASYQLSVHVRKPIFPVGRGTSGTFQIQCVAPDPRLYSPTQLSSGILSLPSGGGFTMPFILPVTFSPSSGGTGSANNAGIVSTFPVLTLKGQLTNPYVSNAANGKSMQLTYTVNSGDTVTIDMAGKTITLNGSSSLLSTKTSDSDWWPLNPGNNAISFSSSSSSDTGTLEVTWRNAWLGV